MVVVADVVAEVSECMPSVVRRADASFIDPAFAQAIGVDERLVGGHHEDEEIVFGVARPHAVHGTCHVHVPELAADFLNHADAVTRVVLPALELERIALEVFALQFFIEFEASRAEDYSLAGLDRLFLFSDHRGASDDLLRFRVLDKVFVVAVEQHLDAQILALLIEYLERGHTESRRVGDGLASCPSWEK